MSEDTTEARLSIVAGEPVTDGMMFMSTTSRSLLGMALRPLLRAAGKGGIGAKFGAGGNLIGVTATRVLLYRGLVDPFVVIAEWPRSVVTGDAVRKTWVGRGEQLHSQDLFKTTLHTPDGDVKLELDQKRGGEKMLKALGISIPR